MRRSRGWQDRNERRVAGLLSLTVVIVLFGAIVRIVQIPSTIWYSDCQFAAFWVSGWFEFSSLFQWTALTLALLSVLWLATLMLRDARSHTAQTLMQGLVLASLWIWLLSLKAYLFPFAEPSAAHYAALANRLNKADAIIVDAEDRPPARWPQGIPPPQIEFSERPLWRPEINKRLPEIFTSRFSPTGADYERMQTCVAEQKRALAQYEKDRETLKDYWRRVDLAVSPRRPRDWREEVDEELALESAEQSAVSDE